jgi:hypothetical protein
MEMAIIVQGILKRVVVRGTGTNYCLLTFRRIGNANILALMFFCKYFFLFFLNILRSFSQKQREQVVI